MTPLLTEQLCAFDTTALTQELLTLRARLLRRQRTDPAAEDLLETWAFSVEEERKQAHSEQTPQPTTEAAEKRREVIGHHVSVLLESASQRMVDERPSLEHYSGALSVLKSPAPYVPEAAPLLPFSQWNSENHPEYKSYLEEARTQAIVASECQFRFTERGFQRGLSLFLGVAGTGLALLALLLPGMEPSTIDAMMLVGFNALLGAAILQVHTRIQRTRAQEKYTDEMVEIADTAAHKEIDRRERTRLENFLDEAREQRETFEASDSERRFAHAKVEGRRIHLVREVLQGKATSDVLEALFPLALPAPCTTKWRLSRDGRLDIRVILSTLTFLPPSVDGLTHVRRPPVTGCDRMLEATLANLAGSLAIRHLVEVFFSLPSLRSARVTVMRPADHASEQVKPILQVDADRGQLVNVSELRDLQELLRGLRHRFHYENLPTRTSTPKPV